MYSQTNLFLAIHLPNFTHYVQAISFGKYLVDLKYSSFEQQIITDNLTGDLWYWSDYLWKHSDLLVLQGSKSYAFDSENLKLFHVLVMLYFAKTLCCLSMQNFKAPQEKSEKD